MFDTRCLFDEIEMTHKQSCIRSKLHYPETKIILSPLTLTMISDTLCQIPPTRCHGDIIHCK